MSSLFALTLFLVVGCTYGYTTTTGVPYTNKNVSMSNETNGKCKTDFSCVGCSEILLCKKTESGYQRAMTLKCKAPAPYCDDATASCVSVAPLPCAQSDNFTCMKDGVFPDATNCSKYHFCKHSVSFSYSCPKGKYFDAIRQECTSTYCYGFDCKNKHGLKTFHKGNKIFYAYCGDSLPVLVTKCELGYELNEAIQRCVLVCKGAGHFVDIEDCTKYYQCDTRNARTSHDCPNSFGFDPVNLRCVPLAMLPSCK